MFGFFRTFFLTSNYDDTCIMTAFLKRTKTRGLLNILSNISTYKIIELDQKSFSCWYIYL